jgi:hypothetical protein
MDFETHDIARGFMCSPDLDDLHYHHIFAPYESFFHVEVCIADGPYPNKGVFLKRIRVQGDENRFAMIDKGFAIGKKSENMVGSGVFSKKGK